MKQLSREEWIAVTIAVVIGLGFFMLSFFLFGLQSLQQELREENSVAVHSDSEGEMMEGGEASESE